MSGSQIEKPNSVTRLVVIGGKVCVTTERKDAEDKEQMWLNEERFS